MTISHFRKKSVFLAIQKVKNWPEIQKNRVRADVERLAKNKNETKISANTCFILENCFYQNDFIMEGSPEISPEKLLEFL